MEVLAACHLHSDWSYDGSWSLEALAARFKDRGYRVMLMTEHDRGFTEARQKEHREQCARVSSEQILVVPGIEYSDAANRVHVLVWGNVPFLGEALPTGEMLEKVRVAKGVAVLAHPSRKQVWKSFEPAWAERLVGIELWNRKYDGWAPSETAPELLGSCSAMPFVGLDFHTARQSFPLGMALDIPGPITEETVLECIAARKCSPRAFGLPLTRTLFRRALPALNVAEHGRRTVASMVRRTGVLTR